MAAAAGDQGMANLLANGDAEQDRATLAGMLDRIPAIGRRLT